MKTKWKIFFLMAGILMTFNYYSTAQDTSLYALTVEVNHLRNEKGMVQFALYNKDGSIPDEKYLRYYKIGRSPIASLTAKYKLPACHWANMRSIFYTMRTIMNELT